MVLEQGLGGAESLHPTVGAHVEREGAHVRVVTGDEALDEEVAIEAHGVQVRPERVEAVLAVEGVDLLEPPGVEVAVTRRPRRFGDDGERNPRGSDGLRVREAHDLGLGRGEAEPLAGAGELDLVAGAEKRVMARYGADDVSGKLAANLVEGEHEGIRGGNHDETLRGVGHGEDRDLLEELGRLDRGGAHEFREDARVLDDGNEGLVDTHGPHAVRLVELAGVGVDRDVATENDGEEVLAGCGGRARLGGHGYSASFSAASLPAPRLASRSRLAFSSEA